MGIKKAIAMVEYANVSSGMVASDLMAKTASVDIIWARVVCPGKYIALVAGALAAVRAAVDAACAHAPTQLISSFVLGNPDEALLAAIRAERQVEQLAAVGILETLDAATIIVAADVAVKAATVDLFSLRIAGGMCGKSYLLLSGELACVQTAIDCAKAHIEAGGMYLDSALIARPDEQMKRAIMGGMGGSPC